MKSKVILPWCFGNVWQVKVEGYWKGFIEYQITAWTVLAPITTRHSIVRINMKLWIEYSIMLFKLVLYVSDLPTAVIIFGVLFYWLSGELKFEILTYWGISGDNIISLRDPKFGYRSNYAVAWVSIEW